MDMAAARFTETSVTSYRTNMRHIPEENSFHLYHVIFISLFSFILKSYIFRGITPWSSLKINWLFGGTCCLHLHCRKIRQVRNLRESRWLAEPLDIISQKIEEPHILCFFTLSIFILSSVQCCFRFKFRRIVFVPFWRLSAVMWRTWIIITC